MRATLEPASITLQPGRPARVVVSVTNTLGVIDGVSVTADARLGFTTTVEPSLLPLFPEGSGEVTIALSASATLPAGDHEVPLYVSSAASPEDQLVVRLRVTVLPVPAGRLTVTPAVTSGRRRGTFTVICENLGNTVLDVSLAASDAERAVQAGFDRPELVVRPGGAANCRLSVQTGRRWLGADFGHQILVIGTSPDLELDTQARFRQRPVFPRGVRTALTLGAIIALWAVIFVVALNHIMSKDPLAKDAPASFYAASQTKASTASFNSGGAVELEGAAADGSAPAGAVPKSGVDIGIGGTITGTVDATSTQAPIGRITVEAVRDTPTGPTLVASAATDGNGSYSLEGLLPGSYKLLFTAQGYTDVWYPAGPTETGAQPVTVDALATVKGIDAVIAGRPGSITGTIQTGQTPEPPVTVVVLGGQGQTTPIAHVTTDANGNYTVPNLPAPGTYDLSFTSPGYQVASDAEDVAGGERHVANTVTLDAGKGSIAGSVTDGKQPLGGVTITATANGQTISSATPTTGAVGTYSIVNLPSPATYVITFTKIGYGTDTIAESLGPGQALTDLSVALAGGAGQISGTVKSPTGAPLGGVTVSVSNNSSGPDVTTASGSTGTAATGPTGTNGSAPTGSTGAPTPTPTAVTTQTLTAGTIGAYVISGLTTPGSYTLTFSLSGYGSQTVGVTLGSSGSASGINVVLPVFNGSISGTVTAVGGGPLTGLTVSETDGVNVHTTITASSPAGGFTLTGLPPGSYSVTFSLTGYVSQTALVKLAPGQAATVPVALPKVATGGPGG